MADHIPQAEAPPPLLVFRSLSKSYGETRALAGVSLDVRPGEVFGLLGPNGAGKSTLIRILMDIIRQDHGEIEVFGEPFHRQALARIGYLPEERGLYTKQKVLDVMVYLGTLKDLPRRQARQRSLAWLKRLELGHTARWKIERLSKGMTQKVQIASALLADPELCVLDEPFSGLDPVNVRLVESLIEERRARGLTTILSAHQMNRVESLCDRIAMIDHGERKVYGTVGEVRRRYSLPEVRLETPDALPQLPQIAAAELEAEGRWRLRLADGAEPQALLRELVHRQIDILRFERVLAPLEDIFIRVVEGDTP